MFTIIYLITFIYFSIIIATPKLSNFLCIECLEIRTIIGLYFNCSKIDELFTR